MKVAILHGAVKNAGDYLIKERTKNLIMQCCDGIEFFEVFRNESLVDRIHIINDCDRAVWAGGPCINDYFLNGILNNGVDSITIPTTFVGGGQFMSFDIVDSFSLYRQSLNSKSIDYLNQVCKYGPIGLRGDITSVLMRNSGMDNVVMEGCPAWYNFNVVNQIKYEGPSIKAIKKICVSDCSVKEAIPQMMEVLRYLRKFFGNSVQIIYVIHRGAPLQAELLGLLEELNITNVDISGSVDGFKIYDDADLHIGYRVHAHIYNLSARKLSILIEEDLRGAEVNSILGLPSIRSTLGIIENEKLIKILNNDIVYQIDDYIISLYKAGYVQMDRAYYTMNRTLNVAEKHVSEFIS